MGIEFVFEMGAPATVTSVGEVMAGYAESRGMAETEQVVFNRDGTYLTTGMIVSNFAPSPPPFPHPVEEQFGFNPVVHVLFSLNHGPGFDSHLQDLDIVRLITAVLTTIHGDALFTFAGELTILTRLRGQLTVNSDSDFWTPDTIALLPSHDTAHLPNL